MHGEPLDFLAALVTGFIAYHGITYRNADGENDFGHMLFGAIALLFCVRFILVDIFALLD